MLNSHHNEGFRAGLPFNNHSRRDRKGKAENLSLVYVNPNDRNIEASGNIVELGAYGTGKVYLLLLTAMRLRKQQTKKITTSSEKAMSSGVHARRSKAH